MDETLYTRVDRYIEELFGLNDPVLQQVLESTVSAGIPEIQVSSCQGRFLYLLAKTDRCSPDSRDRQPGRLQHHLFGTGLAGQRPADFARADRKTRRGDPSPFGFGRAFGPAPKWWSGRRAKVCRAGGGRHRAFDLVSSMPTRFPTRSRQRVFDAAIAPFEKIDAALWR